MNELDQRCANVVSVQRYANEGPMGAQRRANPTPT